nr:HlyD family efflux transporter periplasmic adaptor subunit [Candidatus Peribacteraceae bacterium]
LYGFVPVLAVGAGFVMLSTPSASSTISTDATVERHTIVSSVKAVGEVTFSNEQQMRFNQRGTVAKVSVKEGDTVKQGQLIASLDQTSVQSDIRSAALSVSASRLQLDQLEADREKSLQDAQSAVDQAARQLDQVKNDWEVAKQQLPNDLASAERAVKDREAALAQAKLDLAKAEDTQYQDIGAAAQSVLVSSEKLLDSFYDILTRGTAARPQNGDYEIEIDALLGNDPTLGQSVQFAYYDAVNTSLAMRRDFGTSLSSQEDPTVLRQALEQAQDLAETISDLAEHTYDFMRGATTDTTSFTADELTSLRNSVNANRDSAAGLITKAKNSLSDLSDMSTPGGSVSLTVSAKQNAVQSAENALTAAQEDLAVLQARTPGSFQEQDDAIASAEENLRSKQSALESAKRSNDVSIKLKQNDIAQRSASYAKTAKTADEYELRAPFDGVIRHIDYKVGDNLLDTGDTSSVTIENPDELLVTVLLDQTDVVRVKAGMPASIVLDAVAGRTMTGAIALINPTPVEQSGVVSYQVDVRLPAPKDLTVLSGMTATVQIDTERREQVLAVPNLALRSQNGQATVVSNGATVIVQTGLSDGRYTEIVSGLTEGQSVTATNVTVGGSSSSVNPNQLLRMGGGGGQPAGATVRAVTR